MLKAVFIDIDNTLLDFDAYVRQTLESGFEHFNLPGFGQDTLEIFHRENNKLWRAIEAGNLTFSELEKIRFNKVFEALGIEGDGAAFEKYFRACLNESAIPVEGAHELLEAMSGKYLLCAASNGPYNQQVHRLELAGMKECFDYLFISEEIGFSKPSKEYYCEAFSRLPGIKPEECLMIGDSESSDMTGALLAGMKTCFFNKAKKETGDEYDITVDSLSGIPEKISLLF